MAGNLDNQNFLPIQTRQQAKPPTIASAATFVPLHRFQFVSGAVQLQNITPNDAQAYQEIVLVFTNAGPGLFLTTGNIFTAYQPIQNRPVTLYYDPSTAKWYVMSVT
jgi:hypothetical protein